MNDKVVKLGSVYAWVVKKTKSINRLHVLLTYKEIRYCQIQKVIVALSPQTLVYFESEDNQSVSQDNYNNQSHHHHHQNDKHGPENAKLDWILVESLPK